MIRTSILSDKKDDLSKCTQVHKSLLTELFRVTVALSQTQDHGSNDKNFRNDSEALFLDANKLSEDRFFDLSTLPAPQFHDIVHIPESFSPRGLVQTSTKDQKTTAPALHRPDGAPTKFGQDGREAGEPASLLEGARSSTSILSASKPPLQTTHGFTAGHVAVQQPAFGEGPAIELQTATKAVEGEMGQRTVQANSDSTAPIVNASQLDSSKDEPRNQQTPHPFGPSQFPSEGIGTVLTPTAEVSLLKQSHSNIHEAASQLNSGLETRLDVDGSERARDERPKQEDNGTLAGGITEENTVDQIRHNTVEADDAVQKPAGMSQPGFPSTPDEQLRLEEARSLQHSQNSPTIAEEQRNDSGTSQSIHPTDSLSSQFGDEGPGRSGIMGGRSPHDENGFQPTRPSNEQFGEHNRHRDRPSLGLRDQTLPGMTGNHSKDLTFTRRPPMRIDTGLIPATDQLKSSHKKTSTPSTANSHAPSAAPTPNKSGPATSQAQSPPERMTTRVSSGAIRHKSVSEILGETPKSAAHHGEKGSLERAMNDIQREDYAIQTPKSASSTATPDSAAFRVRLNELREKERSKLSTIVFARQQPSRLSRYSESTQTQRSEAVDPTFKNKDYLLPLFAAQAATPPHSQPLHSLIASAHKTLTTANHYTDFHEQQDCRMLNKIYQLQYSNRWSLRQLERSVEPDRPTTQWDVLLGHVKWMCTDFKEERKWKLAAAKSLADYCALWVASSPGRRRSMQVKVRAASSATVELGSSLALTPELIPSMEDDSSDVTEDDTPYGNIAQGSAPAAIFSLAPDMFVFGLDKTPAAGKLLQELPLYQPSLEIQDAALQLNAFVPDSTWKKPLLPISRFAEGKMITQEQGPPRKRSRYSYQESEDSDQDHDDGIYSSHADASITLEPEQDDVALFDPENKHIRDRIHAGHAFRPPSEHVMPSQSFFESRQSSQWTQGEDDELRRLVRECSYNWSLISSCLSSPSVFSSGAERRTPWECFERWIGLEGLPAEMSKTPYFRTYHLRLQAAQRTHEAQQQAIQQHQGQNTPHMPLRRRSTQPYLVDRRKNVKHFHLVDAMRKLAKKRETAIQKQQHVANLAAMRKANEAVQTRHTMHTPQEFSRIKFERECKLAETAKAYRQQILQHQKAALAQKQQQSGQLAGPNMMQPGRNPTPGPANGTSPLVNPALPNGHPPGSSMSQPRAPPIPRLANGGTPNGVLPTNPQGIPHAQMQPHMQVQPRVPPQMSSDNMRVYQEANRVQQEQQRYLQQQRQQHHSQPAQVGRSASPNMGGNPSLMAPSNSAVLASLQAGGRSGSPNGTQPPQPPPQGGASSSPRMTNPSSSTQPQPLSSGMVPAINQISNQIKARHPKASPEQITKMTTESLNQYRMSHVQAAMHAAAGASNASAAAGNASLALPAASGSSAAQGGQQQQQQQQQQNLMNGGSPMLNPQQYAQMMRSQQSNQQNRNGGGSVVMGGNPGSRSATPQHHRTGSAQGNAQGGGAAGGASQSPRSSHAQMAGGQ